MKQRHPQRERQREEKSLSSLFEEKEEKKDEEILLNFNVEQIYEYHLGLFLNQQKEKKK